MTTERPIGQVRDTRDWLPAEYARLRVLESLLLHGFARAGYEPMRTPVIEFAALHERKSGAGIVAKLIELADDRQGRVCLRPELTAGIVRAYVDAPGPPPVPWRVSMAGVVFRHQPPRPGLDREFTQVGVELIGAGGPEADAEVIGLADRSLRQLGIADATVRIGHVGLILELLGRSGLPPAARASLVEVLSEAAAEGKDVRAVEAALERLSGWLGGDDDPGAPFPAEGAGADHAVHRLFRHLVPDVTGRRTGGEVVGRLRRKWDLGHSLRSVLERLHDQVHALADLRGPAAGVLDRLRHDLAALAPDSVGELLDLVARLDDQGIAPGRVELDLGFGRGIGFYSQMIFELIVPTPEGPVEVCGGGRYDGLARVLGSDRDDRGVGFAFGLERLARVLDARGMSAPARQPGEVLVVADGADALDRAARLLADLHREGIAAVLLVEDELDRGGFPRLVSRAVALGLDELVVARAREPGAKPFDYYHLSGNRRVNASAEELLRYFTTA